ncbi:hypothetical protein ACJJTC_000201 [Scirpophaga incertulas]
MLNLRPRGARLAASRSQNAAAATDTCARCCAPSATRRAHRLRAVSFTLPRCACRPAGWRPAGRRTRRRRRTRARAAAPRALAPRAPLARRELYITEVRVQGGEAGGQPVAERGGGDGHVRALLRPERSAPRAPLARRELYITEVRVQGGEAGGQPVAERGGGDGHVRALLRPERSRRAHRLRAVSFTLPRCACRGARLAASRSQNAAAATDTCARCCAPSARAARTACAP